eukprot:jgi/Chrzof1/12043/Cz06g19070.t1
MQKPAPRTATTDAPAGSSSTAPSPTADHKPAAIVKSAAAGAAKPEAVAPVTAATPASDVISQQAHDSQNGGTGKSAAEVVADKKRCCWHCGMRQEGPEPLSKCSVCRVARYCSRECQVAHWKAHKKECPDLTKQKAASKR